LFRKSRIKSAIASALTVILALSLTLTDINIVRADEGDAANGSQEEYIYNEYMNIEGDGESNEGDYIPGLPTPVYDISVSVARISFGTITQNSGDSYYEVVTVYNDGNTTIHLNYYKADAESVFKIDAPDDLELSPGEEADFWICMKTNVSPGPYDGLLFFESIEDPKFGGGVQVDLSGTVIAPQPIVRSVTVSPDGISANVGSTVYYSASVQGENIKDTSVTWTVSRNTSAGTCINSDGRLVIADDEQAGYLSIAATSNQDRSVMGYAQIGITFNKYTVSTSANPSDGGNTSGGGTFTQGNNVTLMASPNNGYEFVNWTRDGKVVSSSQSYTITNIKESQSLVANFNRTTCYVKVKANHPEGGTISDSGSVKYNGSMTISAKAKSGYQFDGWYEGDKKIADSESVQINNITKNREFTAQFTKNVFDVQLQSDGNGSVSGGGSFKKGTDITITATPYDGYEFSSWTCNNEVISTSEKTTIKNIKQDYLIKANFNKKNIPVYEINAFVAGGSGTISPSGKTQVQKGNGMTYTFAPASGYKVIAVAVDGAQVAVSDSYTFSNISGNHSIAVAFGQIKSETTPTPKKSEVPATSPSVAPSKKEDTDTRKEVPSVPTTDPEIVVVDPDGSTYVPEEADVDPDVIPDDIKDLEPEVDYDSHTGVFQILNITPEEARPNLDADDDTVYLALAAKEQYLCVSIQNEMADVEKETENTSYFNVASVPNMDKVVSDMLTTDEKLYAMAGNEVDINLSIYNTSKYQSDAAVEIERKAFLDNIHVGDKFDIVLMKKIAGVTDTVTTLNTPLTVRVKVPKSLKSEGRKFVVIRSHADENGNYEITYLENTSVDPNYIQFSTDRFSTYAIGYTGGEGTSNVKRTTTVNILVAFIIVAIIATIFTGASFGHRRRRRHHRRHHAAAHHQARRG